MMNPITTFFAHCAGADTEILSREECKGDRSKMVGIGATVVGTAVLAFCSGGYALFTTFENQELAITGGIIWGLIIFNFDRYIVTAMRKDPENPKKGRTTAAIRIALALVLGFAISYPLKMRFFEKEINQQIEMIKIEKVQEAMKEIDKKYQEIPRLREENNELQAQVDEKAKQRDRLYHEFKREAEGTGGTGRRGRGPVFREKKQQYDRIEGELQAIRTMNQRTIEENRTEIAQLQKLRQRELDNIEGITSNYNGFLARAEAFSQLAEESSYIANVGFFILLVFIAIEVAPVFAKLTAPTTAYDYLMHARDQEVYHQMVQTIGAARAEQEKELGITMQTNAEIMEAERSANKELLSKMAQAQLELADDLINEWKEGEKAKQFLHIRGN